MRLQVNQSNFPVNNIAAIDKYIINPVTSTSVATNGADAAAGSNPNLLSISGIIEPANVPQRTTKITATDTVTPIHIQNSP